MVKLIILGLGFIFIPIIFSFVNAQVFPFDIKIFFKTQIFSKLRVCFLTQIFFKTQGFLKNSDFF